MRPARPPHEQVPDKAGMRCLALVEAHSTSMMHHVSRRLLQGSRGDKLLLAQVRLRVWERERFTYSGSKKEKKKRGKGGARAGVRTGWGWMFVCIERTKRERVEKGGQRAGGQGAGGQREGRGQAGARRGWGCCLCHASSQLPHPVVKFLLLCSKQQAGARQPQRSPWSAAPRTRAPQGVRAILCVQLSTTGQRHEPTHAPAAGQPAAPAGVILCHRKR